jgi:hypothetical protein
MWRIVAIFLLSFCFVGCKGHREFKEARKKLKAERAERKAKAANSTTPVDSLEIPVFSMQRGYCFGTCPVFEFKLFENGLATYTGTANVENIGTFQAKNTQALRDSILSAAENIGFIMLLDNYDNQFITDLPATNYSLKVDDREKVVVCRFGCPESLIDFGTRVQKWVEAVDWEIVKQK